MRALKKSEANQGEQLIKFFKSTAEGFRKVIEMVIGFEKKEFCNMRIFHRRNEYFARVFFGRNLIEFCMGLDLYVVNNYGSGTNHLTEGHEKKKIKKFFEKIAQLLSISQKDFSDYLVDDTITTNKKEFGCHISDGVGRYVKRIVLRKNELSEDCVKEWNKLAGRLQKIIKISDQLNKHLKPLSGFIDNNFYTGQTDEETRRKKSLQNLLGLKSLAVKKIKKELDSILVLQKSYKRIAPKRLEEVFISDFDVDVYKLIQKALAGEGVASKVDNNWMVVVEQQKELIFKPIWELGKF